MCSWTDIAIVLLTSLLTGITGWYAHLTGKLVRAQTSPFLTVTPERNDVNGFVSLVIVNHGLGPAFDVQVTLPSEFRDESLPPVGSLKRGPVGHGVPILGPHQRIAQVWAHEKPLWHKLAFRRFEVEICWRERPDGPGKTIKHGISLSTIDPIRFPQKAP